MKIYGVSELANEIGAKRDTVSKWYQRGKLPPPTRILASGPVWRGVAIERWISQRRSAQR